MSELAFSCYKQIFALGENVMQIGDSVPIPRFSESHLFEIINESIKILSKGSPLVHSSSGVVIVGDLHGSLHDMFRIFAYYGYPPKTKYIFLGDYVDRGDFSLEVITFLLVCFNKYPDYIVLLRGNHEFDTVNGSYGFKASVEAEYGNDRIWERFNFCFSYLPIACIIDDETICLHGGISEGFTNISQLKNKKLPLNQSDRIVSDITWSDPTDSTALFLPNNRGLGQSFGQYAFNDFLRQSHLTMMIRGHECVNGIKPRFEGRLVTVFSASNYANAMANKSGALLYINRHDIVPTTFSPLERMPKAIASFFSVVCPSKETGISLKSMADKRRSLHLALSENTFLKLNTHQLRQQRSIPESLFHKRSQPM